MLVRFNKQTIVAGTIYSPSSGDVDIANDLADQVVRQGNGVVVGLGELANEVAWRRDSSGNNSLVGSDGAEYAALPLDEFGNASAHIIPRTNTLAGLQSLDGVDGELASATDEPAIVQFTGLPGGARTFYPLPVGLRLAVPPSVSGYIPQGTYSYTIGVDFSTLDEALTYLGACVIHPAAVITVNLAAGDNPLTLAELNLPNVIIASTMTTVSGTVASSSGASGSRSVVLNITGGTVGVVNTSCVLAIYTGTDNTMSLSGRVTAVDDVAGTATVSLPLYTTVPLAGQTFTARLYKSKITCSIFKGRIKGFDDVAFYATTFQFQRVITDRLGYGNLCVVGNSCTLKYDCDIQVINMDVGVGTFELYDSRLRVESTLIAKSISLRQRSTALVDYFKMIGANIASSPALKVNKNSVFGAAVSGEIFATGTGDCIQALGGSQVIVPSHVTVTGVTATYTPALSTLGADGGFIGI